MKNTLVFLLACGLVVLGCKKGKTTEDQGASSGGAGSSDPGPYVDPKPGPALPADAAWVTVTSGTDAALAGVWISPDVTLAVAVGQRGTILTSSDRGATWTPSTSGVTVDLAAVWGSEKDDVFAVGSAGTILHSTDGAHTWTRSKIDSTADMLSVWGSGPKNVFVGGSSATIFRSRDEGASFVAVNTPALTRIAGIWGVDPLDVYAVASAGLLVSSTGGDHFANGVVSLAQQNAVWASKIDDVYTVNGAGVVTHWDGSNTASKTILTPVRALHAIWGTGDTDLYVAGDLGRIAHSANGGDDWIAQDANTTSDLLALHGAEGVMLATGTRGTILRRTADVRVPSDAGADAN